MVGLPRWRYLAAVTWIAALVADSHEAAMYSQNVRALNGSFFSQSGIDCGSEVRQFNPLMHKSKYRMAVHAIRGLETAAAEFLPLGEYLTKTAGRRFSEPVEFEIVPVDYKGLFSSVETEAVDFFHANPAIYSCVGVEQGAQPLATVVQRLEVRGNTYELDVFGGVIFARADNDAINTIEDLKDSVIGGGEISMIMAGQLQFYEMQVAGMSYVMDPKKVVFTGDQGKVVAGVLSREFDVGFVRTDQIELTKDANGKPLDPDTFKVISPKVYVLDDGQLFPFMHSTDIYPEWPVAAISSVPADMAEEVQKALLAIEDHSKAALTLNATGSWDPSRCDTTLEIANSALKASISGHIAGFRTARPYFKVRTMQEAAGFLVRDAKGNWKCTREDTLYQSVECPTGFYKLPVDEFEHSCQDAGLSCTEGYRCYCKPCIKAFEVDVFEWNEQATESKRHTGCPKMSVCGSVEQAQTITFRVVDNKERPDGVLNVTMHLANHEYNLPVRKVDTYTYEFDWSNQMVGVGIMEIYVNDEQIPESPIRVQVVDRMCELDYPGQDRTASNNGECVCSASTIDMNGKCVSSTIIAIVIATAVALFLVIVGFYVLRYNTHKGDQMWQINVDELHLDDPPEVIGQGSFGVVLLAEYRGTRVAIKRAVKQVNARRRSSHRSRSKAVSKGSKTGSKGRSNASRVASDTPTHDSNGVATADLESVGLSSIGMSISSSVDSSDDTPETDPETGLVVHDQEQAGKSSDSKSGGKSGNSKSGGKRGGSKSGGKGENEFSLGFLAADFGKRKTWTRFLPWASKDEYYHNRFRETVLGSSGSSISKKGLISILFPCFSQKVMEEEEFIAEMRVLSRLRHPCVTTVMGAVFSHTHDPMLVMEYMEYGSLYDLLRNETMHLSGEVIMQISRDVAQGLRYLHSSKPPILHGDLKARNILVDSRFRAKLCDFGLSTKNKNLITGTPYWLAPEYLRGQAEYNPACDIYSMGIIFYEIYSRKNPYEGEHLRETLRKICDRRVNKRPPIPPSCPPKMAELMKKCWSPDPSYRPQAKDLDTVLLDLNVSDAEPLHVDVQMQTVRTERRTGDMLYELFPRHIADALKAGKKVEPEQHDLVTVIFSDIVHFTDISREISPLKVSNMLDRLYMAFDKIARKHQVFKVETIGDAYMGVTNLEKKQEDTHVRHAAGFAIDMVNEASKILIDEEEPTKGYINIRVGFHSGPVVSNVIGSLNPRYGLFGDTVNTASRMESNSKPRRILCSEKSYRLLVEQAPDIPIVKRGQISVKGKGEMQVYWIGDKLISQGKGVQEYALELAAETNQARLTSNGAEVEESWRKDLRNQMEQPGPDTSAERSVPTELSASAKEHVVKKPMNPSTVSISVPSDLAKPTVEKTPTPANGAKRSFIFPFKHSRLIEFDVEVLYSSLEKVVLARQAKGSADDLPTEALRKAERKLKEKNAGKIVFDEMSHILPLPSFDSSSHSVKGSPSIPSCVKQQLYEYVAQIASLYRNVPFHNFEHASHVIMSAGKMMKRIVNPDGIDYEKVGPAEALEIHAQTYGICSDRLMQFAVVFSALIHDVDHTGLTNAELTKMGANVAETYRNKSIAEQNSVDVAWAVLMDDRFKDLRACIYTNEEELVHFRQLLVNAVMATDIADKELNMMRENRWEKAFSELAPIDPLDLSQLDSDRRATVVYEYIIQCSDVAHTMQHWHTYQRFNRRFFAERYLAWRDGHAGKKDPSGGWYKGELWFFDNYIIPLAKKLERCRVFGASSDEFLNYAKDNRKEWESRGRGIVAEMLESCQEKYDNVDGEVEYFSDEDSDDD